MEKNRLGIALCLILAMIFVWFILCRKRDLKPLSRVDRGIDNFGSDDQDYALAALEDLDAPMLQHRMPNEHTRYYNPSTIDGVSPEEATLGLASDGEGAGVRRAGIGQDSDTFKAGMEKVSFNHPVKTDQWPYYFYTKPYQYDQGGSWPPNMFNRINNWQPGFETSGWSSWMRPGIAYDTWPRNRWVKQNGSKYFINNGSEKDRINDYTGEPS